MPRLPIALFHRSTKIRDIVAFRRLVERMLASGWRPRAFDNFRKGRKKWSCVAGSDCHVVLWCSPVRREALKLHEELLLDSLDFFADSVDFF